MFDVAQIMKHTYAKNETWPKSTPGILLLENVKNKNLNPLPHPKF